MSSLQQLLFASKAYRYSAAANQRRFSSRRPFSLAGSRSENPLPSYSSPYSSSSSSNTTTSSIFSLNFSTRIYSSSASRSTFSLINGIISNSRQCSRNISKGCRLAPWTGLSSRLYSSSAMIELAEGDIIELNNGNQATIVAKLNSGWWTVIETDKVGAVKEVKVRTSDIKLTSMPRISSQVFGSNELLSNHKIADRVKNIQTVNANSHSSTTSTSSTSSMPGLLSVRDVGAEGDDFSHLPIDLPTILAPSLHASTYKWIIFSDIHVKSSSIDTCERILEAVHEAAVKRNAGILFLGDFWHVRGALSVDLLNRVMKSLKDWTQPIILIPGNHDQVTLGGMVHAIEPLSYAFSKNSALLISEPSLCLGALWLPYRRNYNYLQRILQDPIITSSSNEDLLNANPSIAASVKSSGSKLLPPVSMIFCHADVRGAYMNDGARCDSGLELSDFPGGIPVYSGHFHKPHTMKLGNSRLRYVGSPYQTSLSEAGQAKFLYCMGSMPSSSEITSTGGEVDVNILNQRRQWYEEERWEIDIGRKYYKLSSIFDSKLANVKTGDRAILSVPFGEESAVRRVAEDLLAKGVEVELKYESKPTLKMDSSKDGNGASSLLNAEAGGEGEGGGMQRGAGSPSLDSLDPLTVFDIFMKTNHFKDFLSKTDPKSAAAAGSEGDGGGRTESFFKRVYVEGKDLLHKLNMLETSTHGDVKVGNGESFHDIKFETVSLNNFGPYGGAKPVVYPLSDRGLVLMRGASTDRSGADSNGSGKTTLAMSVLWALTGSMDARLVSDGKITEVAFEDSSVDVGSIAGAKGDAAGHVSKSLRTAEVKLLGQVNNKPFVVTRRRGKKSELFFEYENKDCSMQSVKDTQELINRTFGIDSGKLQRSCFFGQHSHTMQSLLGLSDSRFKSELSLLVNNTSLFVAAANSIKVKDRSEKQSLNNLGVEKNIRNQELSKALTSKVAIDSSIVALSQQIEKEKQQFIDEFNKKNSTSYNPQEEKISFTNVDILLKDLEQIQLKIKEFQNTNIEKLRVELDQVTKSRVSAVKSIDENINKQRQLHAIGNSSLQTSQLSLSNLSSKFKAIESQIGSLEAQMQLLLPGLKGSPYCSGSLFDMSVDNDALRSEYNNRLSKRSSFESQRNALNTAMSKISATMKLDQSSSSSSKSDVSSSNSGAKIACHDSVSTDESCPTCGQELSFDKLNARFSDLASQLSLIEPEYLSLNNSVSDLKRVLDASSSWIQLQDKRNNILSNQKDTNTEISKLTALTSSTKTDLLKFDLALSELRLKKAAAEGEYLKSEQSIKEKIHYFQTEISKLHKDEQVLRQTIEQSRKMEKLFSSSQGELKNKLSILEERKNALIRSLNEKSDAIADLEGSLKRLDGDAAVLHENIAVNGMLSLLFGPRGIQHFIYLDIISALQKTANGYLNILSQGGLQLGLQSLIPDDVPQARSTSIRKKAGKSSNVVGSSSGGGSIENSSQPDSSSINNSSSSADLTTYDASSAAAEDRIIKSVYIRNSSNNYSERSISQLSGGQYRRVSLALDLAFTECLRRKGLLRSNLLVMDESLTHLDARGREAVGQLLRALVRQTSSSELSLMGGSSSSSSDGSSRNSTADASPSSAVSRNSKISLDSESIHKIEYLDDMSDTNGEVAKETTSSSSSSSSSSSKSRGGTIDEDSATCVPYSTIIVILQDLIATELEEAFDHIDIVKKESDVSTVIIDDH